MNQILKQIQKLEITTRKLVDGLITGHYHSVFRGQGIDFSEIRDYRPGDDVRAIDWKVTARFNKPYIKEFIEERDLRVFFLMDVSGSSLFGNTVSKNQKAIELIASLMFAALRNNDNVGLFLFTDRIEKYIPARKGKRHVLKVLNSLLSFEPEHKHTDIEASLKYISRIVKKRSIMFLISDFFGPDFVSSLKILKNRHDLVAINLKDNREFEIPDIGLIELEDEETGEQLLVDTSDAEFRSNYARLMQDHHHNLINRFQKHKVDSITLYTDEPYATPLKEFFKRRSR